MILRTSGIGVSIVFLREAQWGSRGREFDSRHSDQTLLGRTFFGRVRPGSFFVFIDGFVGEVEVEDELGVGELDVIHKGIHRAAAVGLGALEGGNTELLQQEQKLIEGEGDRLFGGERRKLIGKRILLLLRDGRKISIDCTGVEDALDDNGTEVRTGLPHL